MFWERYAVEERRAVSDAGLIHTYSAQVKGKVGSEGHVKGAGSDDRGSCARQTHD